MHDKKDMSDIPQLWAIYKEVMGYFASGVRGILHFCTLGVQLICSSKCRKKVSHLEWRHHGRNTSANTDQIVTALLADDNWGNLQAVMPTDRDHAGGGGIYYHADCESCYPLSDVGDPRDYKWTNTVSLAKSERAPPRAPLHISRRCR